MRITGVASALPAHQYPQKALTGTLKQFWGDRLKTPELLERLHSRTGVASRHLAFPVQRYPQFSSWGETNAAWFEVAQELGERAIDRALENAGLSPQDLNALFVVSITGIASPSLDARLINRMQLRADIKRTPIFGVGCVGGALGLTRAADYTLAYQDHNAVLLAVEACSLTLQRDDLSTVNLIASGLFGDGAAAVIVSGAETTGSGPRILGNGSFFYPDSEDLMGWDISENGFKIVLSAGLPEFIRSNLARDVDAFLKKHELRRGDIGNWVIHAGGPRVLEAIEETLGLEARHLDRSWDCLSRVGNLSSASVLLVLEDIMANHRPAAGTLGVLLAMGPGFCSEMILLQW
jgi:alkylresorcinol/alkylpyrone synthase